MVSDIYKKIGQAILDSIEEDWTNAILNIEFIGSIGTNLIYFDKNNNEKSEWLESDENIEDEIEKLHQITTEGGNNKWNKAVFSLKPDGDFNMEFIWDQELQDEVESF